MADPRVMRITAWHRAEQLRDGRRSFHLSLSLSRGAYRPRAVERRALRINVCRRWTQIDGVASLLGPRSCYDGDAGKRPESNTAAGGCIAVYRNGRRRAERPAPTYCDRPAHRRQSDGRWSRSDYHPRVRVLRRRRPRRMGRKSARAISMPQANRRPRPRT